MEIRKVEMLTTSKGSTNGVTVEVFDAGVVYELPIDLAVVFVEKMGVAKYHTEHAKPGPKETRDEVQEETREDSHKAKHKKG